MIELLPQKNHDFFVVLNVYNFSAQVGNKPKHNPSSQLVRTNCKTLIKGSTARQTCCDRKKNSEVRRKCNNAATQIQSDGGQTNRKEQQSAIFNNDGNTQVGKQIGPDSAFNNQPGGKIILFGYEKNCSGMELNYNLPF